DDRNGKPVYLANPARACRECQERLLENTPPGPPPADMGKRPANSLAETSSAAAPARAASVDDSGVETLPADAHGSGAHPPVLAPHVLGPRTDFLIAPTSPARPAPPTTTATPGSWASTATSPLRCGWASTTTARWVTANSAPRPRCRSGWTTWVRHSRTCRRTRCRCRQASPPC